MLANLAIVIRSVGSVSSKLTITQSLLSLRFVSSGALLVLSYIGCKLCSFLALLALCSKPCKGKLCVMLALLAILNYTSSVSFQL